MHTRSQQRSMSSATKPQDAAGVVARLHVWRYDFSPRVLVRVFPRSLCSWMPTFVRLRGFPQGLGKGQDAAVVGRWLNEVVQQVGEVET